MNKVLKNSWALFLGMGFSNDGLWLIKSSLLGVRAVKEEFSLAATGFMMSGYFVGYFIGSIDDSWILYLELVISEFLQLLHL